MNTDKKPTLQGKFYGSAHDHQVYAIKNASHDILDEISKVLIARFGCTQPLAPTVGWNNVMHTHCQKDNIEIELGWHPLSGFSISCNSDDGKALLKKIGVYLNTVIGEADFQRYVRHE